MYGTKILFSVMAAFEYKAFDKKGSRISGVVDGDTEGIAKAKLRQKGIFPISMARIEPGKKSKKRTRGAELQIKWFARVSPAELSLFTRQVSTLLSAGFPLVKSISTLIPQIKSKVFQKVLLKIKGSIEQGNSYADSLSIYPNIFSPVYVNMVRAGESSGTLEVVLERLADVTEKKEDTKKKIQASMAYPVLMIIIGVVVLTILMAYVVPGIVKIFSDMNQILPLPTRILIQASSFVQAYWWGILLIFVCFYFMVYLVRQTKKGAFFIDTVLISFPLIGNLIAKFNAARFTRTLTSLLANGLPMVTALNITKSISDNMVLEKLITRAAQNVEQGGEISTLFEQSKVFPYLATQMIKVGEQSGEIEKMLDKTADLFEKDVESAVVTASALITPVIILIMGVMVALIIFAICLPIFEINQLIR